MRGPSFFNRPGLLSAFLFLATMGLAAALAWQAAGAAASHRAAAETSLAHHATIAAWRFSREGRSWIGFGMTQARDLLLQETSRLPALPGPELLLRVLAEKECDCMSAGFARTVFLLRNQPGAELLMRGEPLSERAQDALAGAARASAIDTAPRQGPRQWQILAPGEPRLNRATDVVLLWKVGDRTRGVRGVYGMVVDPAQIARPLKGALGEAQFFPPSLIPARVADSLVRIEVSGPNRQPLFDAGPDTHSFVGTDTLGAVFGHLVVTAAIAPAAQVLLVGGLPASRAPTIIALLSLSLAMGVAALLLMRREYRLARLREDFVSGVSHELRTPLTQIRVLSELLQSDGFRAEAEKARATGAIHREALRLTNLVENVLEFARLRRPPAPRPPEPVALADVAHEVAESFSPLLGARSTQLDVVVEEDLTVHGDRDAINRVLRNLIENAVKYGSEGQTVRLTVGRAAANGVVRVTVDDQGPGIPDEDWTRIWQPYYRLDRDRNGSAGGSGLGLSVVADLMRLLGGRAFVGHAPGGGARFTVEFPGAAPQRPSP